MRWEPTAMWEMVSVLMRALIFAQEKMIFALGALMLKIGAARSI